VCEGVHTLLLELADALTSNTELVCRASQAVLHPTLTPKAKAQLKHTTRLARQMRQCRSNALCQLGVATDEIDPASRETTINLSLLRKPGTTPLPNTPVANTPLPGHPTPTPRPTITPFPMKLGQSTSLSYYLTPATKTVILDGGASTATVQIMPDICDAYVAVRTPEGNLVFVNSFSHLQQNYTSNPVPIVRNSQIIRLTGPIFTFRMTSLNFPGHYKIYAVMVPPGASVWDSNNWISNVATIYMSYGIVAE